MSTFKTPVPRGDLDRILGLRIRRAHGAVRRHFADSFTGLGLTQKQVSVLWLVGDRPDIAQTDLAAALDIDRATMMTLVHGLEKRAYIERSAVPDDARRVAFRLTGSGALLLVEAKAAIAAHEDWLKSRFTASELARLEEMLERIYA